MTEQESDQPAGTVLAQDPAPGKVDAGSTVKLTVSKGVGQVAVPNVANLDVVTATSQLSTAGLAVTQAQEPSERVDAGTVIRTDPAAGQVVNKGTAVKIVVSSGPPQVGVPMVTGLTESEARDQLQAAGFLASKSDVDVPFGSAQAGKVVSQSPTAGHAGGQGLDGVDHRRQGAAAAADHHHAAAARPPRTRRRGTSRRQRRNADPTHVPAAA